MPDTASAPVVMTATQRWAFGAGTLLAVMFMMPLVGEAAHGRRDWVAEVPYFLIGLSAAMGLVAAVIDPGRTRTLRLDRIRRRTFWVGVILLPAGLALAGLLE